MRSLPGRCLPLVALLLACPCLADIYVYTDSHGVRHFTNVPEHQGYKLVMRTPSYKKSEGKTVPQPSSYAPLSPIITGSGYVTAKAAKPFGINESNRRRFAADIAVIAGRQRLDPALLHAVISAESAFNPRAVSPKGAVGLMQLMPTTAERFGVSNPYDPIANIQGGARYLRLLLDQFKSTHLALAAYNAGEGAVIRYGNAIPPYPETRTYVERVLGFYNHYRRQSSNHVVSPSPTVAQSGSGVADPWQ